MSSEQRGKESGIQQRHPATDTNLRVLSMGIISNAIRLHQAGQGHGVNKKREAQEAVHGTIHHERVRKRQIRKELPLSGEKRRGGRRGR